MNHGSLQNTMLAEMKGTPEPVVGMPATMIFWSDRYPAHVVEVSASGKTVIIQEAKSTHVPGTHGEAQQWVITPDPTGIQHACRKHKDGKWHRTSGGFVVFGQAERYWDPSF